MGRFRAEKVCAEEAPRAERIPVSGEGWPVERRAEREVPGIRPCG